MLKTIEQKLRDKERMEIIRADQETARSIQRFVKKARQNDIEELTERPQLQSYTQYSMENKYINLEKAIKQAYNMVDQQLDFDGFINVISSYNELVNFLSSIVKYNSLSQSLRVPIDERMGKINVYLSQLIDRTKGDKKYNLRNLDEIRDNINSKIYKPVNIDVNFQQFNLEENQKKSIIARIDNIKKQMRAVKGRKKSHPVAIKNWLDQLDKIRTLKYNLTLKKDREKYNESQDQISYIASEFEKKYNRQIEEEEEPIELVEEVPAPEPEEEYKYYDPYEEEDPFAPFEEDMLRPTPPIGKRPSQQSMKMQQEISRMFKLPPPIEQMPLEERQEKNYYDVLEDVPFEEGPLAEVLRSPQQQEEESAREKLSQGIKQEEPDPSAELDEFLEKWDKPKTDKPKTDKPKKRGRPKKEKTQQELKEEFDALLEREYKPISELTDEEKKERLVKQVPIKGDVKDILWRILDSDIRINDPQITDKERDRITSGIFKDKNKINQIFYDLLKNNNPYLLDKLDFLQGIKRNLRI